MMTTPLSGVGVPQIPIAIGIQPIPTPVGQVSLGPGKTHSLINIQFCNNPDLVVGGNLQAVTDEEMLLALTTQLSGQVSEGANTSTIEYNSLTFEYKVRFTNLGYA